jgi:hypothetical protein
MNGNRTIFFTAALCTAALGRAWAQAPQFATLDIAWENGVTYGDDVGDPSRFATSTNAPVPGNVKNFVSFVVIGDIVSVNGKPAKGSFVDGGRGIFLLRNPMPGQAISDLVLRGGMVDIYLEILQSDGTPVGSIMTFGFTGGGPPSGAPGQCCNLTVTGGTGAFQGTRGTLTGDLSMGFRLTSMAEDPANRRINGGTRGHFFAFLIPMAWPDIVTTASGPAVFHADFSPVTSAKPARSGEVLIVTATGLGPTRPGLTPGTPFPDSPLQEVNSPLEVTVNGKPADVLNKIGWPGTNSTYRVDIRVPDGTVPGMASLQLTAAFIQGQPVSIPIQ